MEFTHDEQVIPLTEKVVDTNVDLLKSMEIFSAIIDLTNNLLVN